MESNQNHYQAKMRQFELMDESGNMNWPSDIDGRQQMARALMGIKLVTSVDHWVLWADEALGADDKMPVAGGIKLLQGEAERRVVLKTLNPEQRQAVREMVRRAVKGEFHSFCVALDQTLGGSTISVTPPELNSDQPLEIHSAEHDEMRVDHGRWLDDFSVVFGKDERPKAGT